ncbi:MAG: DUF2459 domain-containing protein [Pleurocapsa sp. MO_192.B19]|nr:DUF2459 domain-containing protein [Pleurocapsa sp. MO_192.B19]
MSKIANCLPLIKPQRIIRYLLGVCSLMVLLPAIGLLIPRKWHDETQASCQYRVCIVNFGYHSNILIPVKNVIFDWSNYLAFNNVDENALSDYSYLGFGWGERTWYINPPTRLDRFIFKGLKAFFSPNRAVLRVQRYGSFPQHQEIECVGMSRANYLKLMKFIKQSFQKDEGGKIVRVLEKPQWHTTFYEAQGTYSLLNNSNHWTATGLRIADINTPLWAGHSAAIMRVLEGNCQPFNLSLISANASNDRSF